MRTHITKNHTKKDKNVTKKTTEKENTAEEMNKNMYEQYGTGTTTNIPSIKDILNYGKADKEDMVKQKNKKKVLSWKSTSLWRKTINC